jgi:DNA-binding response OmpR family regulator
MTNHTLTGQPLRQPSMDRSDRPGIDRGEVGRGDGDVAFRFRRFRVLPGGRQLFVDGRPVELGSRAFDLLMVLLEARGSVVSKDTIMDRVWPFTVVEECNLYFQMSALRKMLGRDRDVIKTVPRRGYLFGAEITAEPAEPAALPPPRPAPASASEEPAADAAGRAWPLVARSPLPPAAVRPTVAVIDDDADVREALDGLLRSAGLSVELFASVQEFLGSARLVDPGCLILDVWLPGLSGLDFHSGLVKANRALPVIFISGHADIPMSVRAMKAGAVEFLTKPVRHEELLQAIEQVLGVPSHPGLGVAWPGRADGPRSVAFDRDFAPRIAASGEGGDPHCPV